MDARNEKIDTLGDPVVPVFKGSRVVAKDYELIDDTAIVQEQRNSSGYKIMKSIGPRPLVAEAGPTLENS